MRPGLQIVRLVDDHHHVVGGEPAVPGRAGEGVEGRQDGGGRDLGVGQGPGPDLVGAEPLAGRRGGVDEPIAEESRVVADQFAPLGPNHDEPTIAADREAQDRGGGRVERVAEHGHGPGQQAGPRRVAGVVKPEHAVEAAGDQAVSVGEEGQGVDRPPGLAQLGKLATTGHVPDPDGRVDAGGRQEPAVGRERH